MKSGMTHDDSVWSDDGIDKPALDVWIGFEFAGEVAPHLTLIEKGVWKRKLVYGSGELEIAPV